MSSGEKFREVAELSESKWAPERNHARIGDSNEIFYVAPPVFPGRPLPEFLTG